MNPALDDQEINQLRRRAIAAGDGDLALDAHAVLALLDAHDHHLFRARHQERTIVRLLDAMRAAGCEEQVMRHVASGQGAGAAR